MFPPDPRIPRWLALLRVHDARAAGASHREIAAALFGRAGVEPDWSGTGDSLRSGVRRLARDAAAMARGGYHGLLRQRGKDQRNRRRAPSAAALCEAGASWPRAEPQCAPLLKLSRRCQEYCCVETVGQFAVGVAQLTAPLDKFGAIALERERHHAWIQVTFLGLGLAKQGHSSGVVPDQLAVANASAAKYRARRQLNRRPARPPARRRHYLMDD